MNNQNARFLPFHAVNEFMRPDYRLEVIRSTLINLPKSPEALRQPLDQLIKRLVKVSGFRNSAKAPAPLKVKPTIEIFEKNSELAAAILSAWAENHPVLRQQIYDLLSERGWEVLPPEADRTQLPGFMVVWPKGEDFEALNAAFKQRYVDSDANSDDISLMVVWVSARLPYELQGEDEEEEDVSEDGVEAGRAPD